MSYNDIEPNLKNQVYNNLLSDCKGIDWIQFAFVKAWADFKAGIWKYDGATFVDEVDNDFYEVAAFIHDWLNSIGYVGKEVDLYFIKIMIALNYSENRIFERCKWMQWTFINVFWHKVKRTFKANDIPEFLK